ncbi:MAG: hypothetical protein ACR2M2_08035 [Gaiellaceae bacterium]|nr:hypothetical protein [Actinomycetota bacterium]
MSAREPRLSVYRLHDSHEGDLLDQAIYHVQHVRLGLAVRPHDRPEPS